MRRKNLVNNCFFYFYLLNMNEIDHISSMIHKYLEKNKNVKIYNDEYVLNLLSEAYNLKDVEDNIWSYLDMLNDINFDLNTKNKTIDKQSLQLLLSLGYKTNMMYSDPELTELAFRYINPMDFILDGFMMKKSLSKDVKNKNKMILKNYKDMAVIYMINEFGPASFAVVQFGHTYHHLNQRFQT